jgi:23S rRNA (uracil1939-C5)-methyltransferase
VPECEYFGRCGGCALQHLDYTAQLAFKQQVVANALSTIARLEPREWLTPISGPQRGYRRRARLGIKYVAGKGRVLVGFRERAAPYITDMASCAILAAPLGQAIADLASTIAATSIRDRIPQAEVALGDTGGALVLRVLDLPAAGDCDGLLEFGRRHDIDIYLQPSGPDSIYPLTDPARTLSYRLDAFRLEFQFKPTDFIQINAVVNRPTVDSGRPP